MATKKPSKKPGTKEAEDAILQWFKCEGEPATVQSMTDALGSKFGKTLVQQVLEECVAARHLQVKDIKKARFYYLAAGTGDSGGDAGGDVGDGAGAVGEALDPVKAELVQKLKENTARLAACTSEIDILAQKKTAAEREKQIAALLAECGALRSRVDEARREVRQKQEQVNDTDVVLLIGRYNQARGFWRERKRMAGCVMDAVVGDSGDPKAVAKLFGLTTDEEAEVSFADTAIALPSLPSVV